MRKSLIFFGMCIIMTGIILAACNMPASTAPEPTPTNTVPFSIVDQSNIIAQARSATETVQALAGTVVAPVVQATQAPGQGGMTGQATATLAGVPLAAATVTNTPVIVPTTGRPATYTLHEGEFCYCIARRFNVNPADLQSINPPCVSGIVSPGTILTIPSSGTWSGERALLHHPTTHTVRAGDTIYTIACAYGDVDPLALIAVNGLSSPYTLTSGQTLQIP